MNITATVHTGLHITKRLANLVICSFFVFPIMAQANCIPVNGKFSSQIVDECESPIGFCTDGQLTGLLKGDYFFSANYFDSSNEPSVPGAFFYTGYSFVSTQHGELQLTDTGTLDLVNGRISSLLTITRGTDRYENASGYLFVTGFSDPVSGQNSGRYEGEICGVSIYKIL